MSTDDTSRAVAAAVYDLGGPAALAVHFGCSNRINRAAGIGCVAATNCISRMACTLRYLNTACKGNDTSDDDAACSDDTDNEARNDDNE